VGPDPGTEGDRVRDSSIGREWSTAFDGDSGKTTNYSITFNVPGRGRSTSSSRGDLTSAKETAAEGHLGKATAQATPASVGSHPAGGVLRVADKAEQTQEGDVGYQKDLIQIGTEEVHQTNLQQQLIPTGLPFFTYSNDKRLVEMISDCRNHYIDILTHAQVTIPPPPPTTTQA